MAALSSFAKGAARSGAEGRRLPYIDIGTDFRPLSLPRQQALALRDAIVACHEREGTGSAYRRQRLMDCGNPVSGGAETWVYKCNLPECPLCYRRRAYRKAAEAARMDAVLKESGFASQMLTITVPDTEADGGALCGIGGGLCQTLQVKGLSPAHCRGGALHRNKHSGYRAVPYSCTFIAAVPL